MCERRTPTGWLCALPCRRSPWLMLPDEARQSPERFIRLLSPRKHSGYVRVERNHNAALGVTGCVLIWPCSAEVVLRKNLVNSNPAGRRLTRFTFSHILPAHGA